MRHAEPVNIGSRDRQFRLVLGVVFLAIGVVLAAYFVVGEVAGWWRALVFIPFAVGISLTQEGRKGVCPILANKGQRSFEGIFATSGVQIEGRVLADTIRRQG